MKIILLFVLLIISCSCNSKRSSDNLEGEIEITKCEECLDPIDEGETYCEDHKCEECGELKNNSDLYCEDHMCEECGELKDTYEDYCEEHLYKNRKRENELMMFSQCASTLKLSEKEIKDYETEFDVQRTDMISSEMCLMINEYILKIRSLNKTYNSSTNELKKNKNALNREIDNGKIESVYALSKHNIIVCHQIIAKKNNTYFWLEVRGNSKCKMGTIQFDENNSNWQEAEVKESPYSSSISLYSMKIMKSGQSLSALKVSMEQYCLGVL